MYLGRVHFYNHVLLVTIQKVKEKKIEMNMNGPGKEFSIL